MAVLAARLYLLMETPLSASNAAFESACMPLIGPSGPLRCVITPRSGVKTSAYSHPAFFVTVTARSRRFLFGDGNARTWPRWEGPWPRSSSGNRHEVDHLKGRTRSTDFTTMYCRSYRYRNEIKVTARQSVSRRRSGRRRDRRP